MALNLWGFLETTVTGSFCCFVLKPKCPLLVLLLKTSNTDLQDLFWLCLRNNLKATHHGVLTKKMTEGVFSPRSTHLRGPESGCSACTWRHTQVGTPQHRSVEVCRKGRAWSKAMCRQYQPAPTTEWGAVLWTLTLWKRPWLQRVTIPVEMITLYFV